MKSYDSVRKTNYLKYLTEDGMKRILSKKIIKSSAKKTNKLNVWDLVHKNIKLFNVKGVSFNSSDKNVFSLFQG